MAEADAFQSVFGVPAPAPPTQDAGAQPSSDQPATAADRAAILGIPAPPPAVSSSDQPGLLSRTFHSILNLPAATFQELVNPTPATAGNVPGQSDALHNFGYGFTRGAQDVLSPASLGALRLGAATGVVDQSTVDRAHANEAQLRSDFEKNYGNSTAASLGRITGQTAITLPALGGAGRALTAGAEALPGVVGTTARFATGATPATGALPRIGQLALQGAGAGGGAGALASGQSDESLASQTLKGAATGAVLGPAVGGITKAADVLRGYAGGLDPAVARLAQTAHDLGIKVPTARLSTNPTMRIMADQAAKLPFSGAFSADLALRRQAQSVIANEMGEQANNLGPEVMKNALGRIRGVFNDVADRTTVQGGAPLLADLQAIGADMPQFALTAEHKGAIAKQFQNVLSAFSDGGGQISGKAYQYLTRTDGPLADAINHENGTVSNFGSRIKTALDNAFTRSASAEDRAALQQARYQYRVMKTVQPLAEKSNAGDIPLGQLRGQVVQQSRKYDPLGDSFAFDTDPGPLNQIARVGNQFLGTLPDSGTPARGSVMYGLSHPLAALAAGVTTAPINAAIQLLLRSPYVSRNVINTSLGGAIPDIGRAVPGVVAPMVSARSEGRRGLLGAAVSPDPSGRWPAM